MERRHTAREGLQSLRNTSISIDISIGIAAAAAVLAEVEEREVMRKGADHLYAALELAEGGRLEEVADGLDGGGDGVAGGGARLDEGAVEVEPPDAAAGGVLALAGLEDEGPRHELEAAPTGDKAGDRVHLVREAHVLGGALLPDLRLGQQALEPDHKLHERCVERHQQDPPHNLHHALQRRVLGPLPQQLREPPLQPQQGLVRLDSLLDAALLVDVHCGNPTVAPFGTVQRRCACVHLLDDEVGHCRVDCGELGVQLLRSAADARHEDRGCAVLVQQRLLPPLVLVFGLVLLPSEECQMCAAQGLHLLCWHVRSHVLQCLVADLFFFLSVTLLLLLLLCLFLILILLHEAIVFFVAIVVVLFNFNFITPALLTLLDRCKVCELARVIREE